MAVVPRAGLSLCGCFRRWWCRSSARGGVDAMALLSKDVVAGMVAAGLAAQQLSQQSGGRPSPHGQAGPWPEDDECKDHQNHFVLRELQQALFVHVAPGVCWGQESYVRVVWTCCVSAGALKPLLMDVLLVTGQARVWKQLQGRRR
ncbi:hypothetical protein Anapl_08659 [Anas platyrhynchos]|uniref:Uncharacterized protein n=1 Tax=Anas platyrhynchos TaxID=8839 RepID=R0JC20_ANAPL|nr:hypothetical protein Anapl_08659 [Anas platyrhynchos]